MDKEAKLIQEISSPENTQGQRFFDLAYGLINNFQLSAEDPRLVLNYRTNPDKLVLIINSRYVITFRISEARLGLIMKRDIFVQQQELFGEWKPNFDEFRKNGTEEVPPIWIWKNLKEGEVLSKKIKDAWLLSVFDELQYGSTSQFRKFHRPDLYQRVIHGRIVKPQSSLEENRTNTTGAGFGTSENNKEIEIAAVKYAASYFSNLGFEVQSVEQNNNGDNKGFDLKCIKEGVALNVEVKGIRGNDPSFIITKNELEAAQENKKWRIFIVMKALSDSPEHLYMDGDEFLKEFEARPIQYFVQKKSL